MWGPSPLPVREDAGGKLRGREVVAATTRPGHPGRLGMLRDRVDKTLYLVDTGSVYSVIPFSSTQRPSGPRIAAANGKAIPCWGWEERTVHTAGRQFVWKFLKAAVAFPLIGTDLLGHYKLLVDLNKMQLKQHGMPAIPLEPPPEAGLFAMSSVHILQRGKAAESTGPPQARPSHRPAKAARVNAPSGSLAAPVAEGGSAGAASTPSSSPAVLAASVRSTGQQKYHEILEFFPKVVNPSKNLPAPIHEVRHHIETTGRPVAAKYRRLDPEKLQAAKKEFAEMEKQGVVRRSKSQWASPLHMVRKEDGSWRPCGDYRQLNLQTVPDRYTCPNIGDLTARLAGCKVFSKLDLRKGYYQIPVKEEDIQKTAVVTPFGLFEFCRTPFGLRNAGQTFQRMMDQILAGLPYCFVYLDDILIATETHQQHVEALREVLGRLQQHGLVLNAEKCVLGVDSVDYLGHRVTSTGISPLPGRLDSIRKFPQPQTVKGLQTYLGMVNFYRRFLKGAAQVLRPLTDALAGQPKGDIAWTKEMEDAFVESKKAMYAAVELTHPVEGADLCLAVDASGSHVGAVLQQASRAGGWRPLAFFSAKLDSAQKKYSAFDRELLACYLAIKHFRWLVEGRPFHILTDHKPLLGALARVSDGHSA